MRPIYLDTMMSRSSASAALICSPIGRMDDAREALSLICVACNLPALDGTSG